MEQARFGAENHAAMGASMGHDFRASAVVERERPQSGCIVPGDAGDRDGEPSAQGV